MSTPDIERLQSIKTLPSLIAYLRDELGWPIEQDMVEDDLTFEFSPEELGLAPDQATEIKEIKQLRPMDSKQPWGIFWVNFEKKRLPVVMLRRILGHLVVKKRVSANKATQRAWQLNDLLFISAYGEDSDRAITFAHFAQDAESPGDLPVLKVLGWDGGDTVLHLADAHRALTEKLRWPDDPRDIAAWRDQWGRAFTLRHREVISTTQELVVELAQLATSIRKRADTILARESDRGPMRRLYAAFKTALIHDLSKDDFADVIAQTISYGLLTASFSRPAGISVQNLVDMVPPTNPFLRELLGEFLVVAGRKKGMFDFDELGIQDVVELLNRANAEAVKSDFGNRTSNEDPIIHFYEHFLAAYDKKKKIQRGVFFTPQPVVSYIVRSVHELLQTEFALEDGLADTTTWGEMAKRNKGLGIPDGAKPDDPFVLILDPATGTATFLVEAIDLIHKTLVAKWKAQGHGEKKIEALWNEYVPKHLLPRLHGYELLMAPYAIAHLKVGLKLDETGYRFGSDERARIYLTNTLEPASDMAQLKLEGFLPALAHEAQAVNQVKRQKRFTVVIGNPPYSGVSSNMTEYAQALVDAFKMVDGRPLNERKHWLQDDYVKFFRISQLALQETGAGVLGVITNHAFLDNPTFRGMRQSLLETFSSGHICDLHGSTKKSDLVPTGISDENVFDIQQGVAITIATKRPGGSRGVRYANLWGPREDKYACLGSSAVGQMEWSSIRPETPYYFFIPKNLDFLAEYQAGWPITGVMPTYVNGIVTARDGFVIDFEDEVIEDRVRVFLDEKRSDAKVGEELGLSENYAWRVRDARRELRGVRNWPRLLTDILYRPFDIRRIIYHDSVVWRTRSGVMRHMMAGRNLALCTNRYVNGEFRHVGVTRDIINDCTLSLATKERTYLFPLFLYPDENTTDLLGGQQLSPNIGADFARVLSAAIAVPRNREVLQAITPEDVLNYVYAVFHSPGYRSRYSEFLKIDFPRLPLPGSADLFRDLARLGGELVGLHLLESPMLAKFITTYVGPKNPEVSRVAWSDDTVWLDAASTKKGQRATPGTVGFGGIPEAVWNFHIGGYQVCEKWLKDRKGRKLLKADIDHYQRVVVALSETIRLMKEIDEVIDKHGGWPAAFATGVTPPTAEASAVREAEVIPLFPDTPSKEYVREAPPLRKVAEPTVERPDPDELDREDLMCRIRQLFSVGEERERETAIDVLARELGYERTGPRIHEELDNALRTAVRRGIVIASGGVLKLDVRRIEDYDRAILKELFLASLQGRVWTEREDAIRGLARWVGFRRTGAAIDEEVRSVINGLIREGPLESAGGLIRRTGGD